MRAGNHKNVKIVGCFLGASAEKKTPFFGIEFMNAEGDTLEQAFYLTDNTADRNVQLLADMGYKGKKLSDMANPNLKVADLFAPVAEGISLVVEEETYVNDKGEEKTKTVIKWVNVGNRGGLSKMDHATAVKTFAGLNFDGLLMQKKAGVKPEPKKPVTENFTDNEIPF